MDLLATLNAAGKQYLVYIDAEFQTYRVSNEDDVLATKKYKNTPFHYGMVAGNDKNNKYHFLLNLGYIIVTPEYYRYNFAIFPSLFMSDAGFENPQILEPGYTTCQPNTDYQIGELRKIIGEKGDFPYYADFSDKPEQKDAFEKINAVYNSSIDLPELFTTFATFTHFINDIAPNALIVHKGQNDLYALYNTIHLFGFEMPAIVTRDLDRVRLHLPDLTKTKLEIVQAYFTNPPPLPNNISKADPVHLRLHKINANLIVLRETLLNEISDFFIAKWGTEAGGIASHNPLVDCAYAAIMDLGLGSSADGAIFAYGTGLAGV